MPLGDRLVRVRLFVALFVLAAIAVGCGSSAPTLVPVTPTPRPTPTPDPHLVEPASVDKVYAELRKAGLSISPNTADSGTDPVKTLHLTYDAWPLILEQYSTADALVTKTGFDPKKKPVFGDPPYEFAGLNIYVAYGPQVQNGAPTAPDERFSSAAARLVAVLDPLLGPLQESAVAPVPLPQASASPTPQPTPTKTPKPTKKPKPKPTKKPASP
jgi:hypothetical protein